MSNIENQAENFVPILTALAPLLTKIPNEVVYDVDKGYGLKLGGFYKDGSITVRGERVGQRVAIVYGRYEVLDEIYADTDMLKYIVELNASRFRYWNEVKPEFKTIDSNWLPFLKAAGLVREEVSYTLI